jgi:hypothetical protein
MTLALRRLLLAAASLVLIVVHAGSTDAQEYYCGFCGPVCYDDTYGLMVCGQRCGHPATVPADCSWSPNPCDPESSEPEWNVCTVWIPE